MKPIAELWYSWRVSSFLYCVVCNKIGPGHTSRPSSWVCMLQPSTCTPNIYLQNQRRRLTQTYTWTFYQVYAHSPKLETLMPSNGGRVKQNVVHPYHGVLLRNTKKGAINIPHLAESPQNYPALKKKNKNKTQEVTCFYYIFKYFNLNMIPLIL